MRALQAMRSSIAGSLPTSQPGWTKLFLRRDTGRETRRDIEGVRAVAVLLVLAYHAGLPVSGGFVGVDVFFVISGFIITGSLVKELQATDTIALGAFYARRAKRLLPATAAVMVATAALTIAFLPKTRWMSTGWDIVASSLYVQNWRLQDQAVDYVAQNQAAGPLQHFWSLAVEEQFYLIWPAVILLVTVLPRKLRPPQRSRKTSYAPWLLVGMLVLVVFPSLFASIVFTDLNPSAAYFVTWTRLWELGIGGMLAVLAPRLRRVSRPLAAVVGWAGLLAVGWSAFTFTDGTAFPGSMAMIPTFGTAAVLGFGIAAGSLGPALVLGRELMVRIGGMSYSLYLWHWPPLVVLAAALGRELSVVEGVATVLASSLVAIASLRLIENPVRYNPVYKARPGKALRLGAFTTLAGVFVGIAVLFSMYPPAPPVVRTASSIANLLDDDAVSGDDAVPGARALGSSPLTSKAGRVVDSVDAITPLPAQALDDNYGAECISRERATSAVPCPLGDLDSTRTVAVVGDSHMAQWALPLQSVAQRRGWRLELFAQQNCTWAADITVDLGGRPYDNCLAWGDDVARRLAADPPDMLITSAVARPMFGETDSSSQDIVAGYLGRWRPLSQRGTKIVVIQDTPRPPVDMHECVERFRTKLSRCAFDKDKNLRNEGALAIAAKSSVVTKNIDLSDAICPRDRCAPVIGGVLVYRDNNHLSATYAGTLAPRLLDLLPKLGKRDD